tara:strand:+ start:749 stop:916 length:168 start_codon:yes stop_codon:yes gene_type:complete
MTTEQDENKGIPGWGIFLIVLAVFLGLYIFLRISNVLLVHHVKNKYMPADIHQYF